MSWQAHVDQLLDATRSAGRYVVIEAWCTGPDDYARKDTLDSALDLRDELRKERPCGRTGPSFFVYDSDDPERGYLDWEDAEDEGRCPDCGIRLDSEETRCEHCRPAVEVIA